MKALLVIGNLVIISFFYPVHASTDDVLGPPAIYIPPPTITDGRGNVIEDGILSGYQVTIFYNYNNTNDHLQPFVMLFEIRDEQGVSQHIAWQSGMAESNTKVTVGISWISEGCGDHEIRIFVIDKFDNPRVLAPVASHSVFIG